MSSTILCNVGSDGGGGGGDGDEEGDASVVAVASARAARRTVGAPRVVRGLCMNVQKLTFGRAHVGERQFCVPLSRGSAESES